MRRIGSGGQMRALLLPIVAIVVIFSAHTKEPTENQMRSTFERSVAAEVADTVTFIGEGGGPEAIERVHMAGNDRFEIRNFRKIDCRPIETKSGFDCAFVVNIILANGSMERSLRGRFYNTSEGIQFALDESPDVAVPAVAESTRGDYIESKSALKNVSKINVE